MEMTMEKKIDEIFNMLRLAAIRRGEEPFGIQFYETHRYSTKQPIVKIKDGSKVRTFLFIDERTDLKAIPEGIVRFVDKVHDNDKWYKQITMYGGKKIILAEQAKIFEVLEDGEAVIYTKNIFHSLFEVDYNSSTVYEPIIEWHAQVLREQILREFTLERIEGRGKIEKVSDSEYIVSYKREDEYNDLLRDESIFGCEEHLSNDIWQKKVKVGESVVIKDLGIIMNIAEISQLSVRAFYDDMYVRIIDKYGSLGDISMVFR